MRPEWLTGDDLAVEAWDRLADLLDDRGTLTLSDGDAITLAAVAESEFRQADAAVREKGLLSSYGSPLEATKFRERSWKKWASALTRLGLDPMSRPRVQASSHE